MDNEQPLATELLHEVKTQSKRWFTAFIIVLLLWFATIGAFIWYISLPVEDYTIEQDTELGGINQIVGGSINGETSSKVQETSKEK